ncbi:MAG: DnaA regulatory inactivator Hda [Pseudomonadota bacterium]|jgi:DnaA family protein
MTLPLALIKTQGPSAIVGLEEFDCLCLDDIDVIAGEREWEEALFLLFNALKDRGAQLVLAAKSPPGQLPFVLEDLRSRLSSGPTLAMKPLSEQESIQALIGHASALGLEMSEPVARYLVHRVERDLGSLIRYLDQLDRASMAAARRLTIPFVKSIIDPLG